MPNINIDDAYILNETGAQVDKVTGLFTKDEGTTSGEKAFAQLNIGTAGSNRNLLDNPWFTVRQRGNGPFSGANTFAMDRWRVTSNSTITCTTNGITITTTVKKWGMQYRVTKDFFIVGKVYTISALEQDGTITNATFTWTGSGLSLYPTGSNVGFEVSTSNGSYDIIYFTTSEVGSVYLRAVKLELGSVSTLANDAPPEYAEELMKCNFYDIMLKTSAQYGYLGYGIADSATSTTILIPLPNNMRDATPTITTGGTITVKGGTSGTHTITGITFKLRVTGGVLVTVATAGLTTGEFCLLQLNNTSSYINISADL